MIEVEKLREELVSWFIENETDLMMNMTETFHGFLGIDDNPYHLEGSVWKHTKMVMDVVEEEYKNDSLYLELLLCGLLHDIGKTMTFQDVTETKRRHFKGHEAFSTYHVKPILEKLSEKYSFNKELVIKVISFHGSLYNYIVTEGIQEKYKRKIFQMFKNDPLLLEYLGKFYFADSTGRITDHPRGLDKNTSGRVRDDLIRISEEISNHIETRVVKDSTLIVLVGPPRVGKSTFVKELIEKSDFDVISRDKYVEETGKGCNYQEKWKSLTNEDQKEIDKRLSKDYQESLKGRHNIIIDMTNMSKKSRRRFLGDKKVRNYHKEARVFIEDIDTLLSRNSEDKDISKDVIRSMISRFVMPDYSEFDEVNIEGILIIFN